MKARVLAACLAVLSLAATPAFAQWESLGGALGGGKSSGRNAQGTGKVAARPVTDLSATLSPEHLGPFRALVIGIDDYQSVPRLDNAVNDASAVAQVLQQDYGFETTLVTDVGKSAMLSAIGDFISGSGPRDNLVIYYAGHGILDDNGSEGYWLPRDAQRNNSSGWIALADITAAMKDIPARKVLVISDSCYSGTLTRTVSEGPMDFSVLTGQVKQRSRIALTSGGLEPVSDAGGSGHSVFAQGLLDVLESHAKGPLDGTSLYRGVRDALAGRATQVPEYADIPAAGHDGGDIILLRR